MKIEEILVNPIENGIEYIGEKQHPRIEIGCRTKSHETMFFVWPNGMGMDPRQHVEVFRLFYKARRVKKLALA
jgi:light-regulated signal transduction histidine kinase (bacteriophytochrome)